MQDLTPASARQYLADKLALPLASIHVQPLEGGVSGLVFRATIEGQPDLVLKQSLAKLRVEQDWFSDRSRIYNEIDALRLLAPHDNLPHVLFDDKPNYLYAMTAAAPGAPEWRTQLLEGIIHPTLAEQAASLHSFLMAPHSFDSRFEGLDLFDQLRLDPYYRATSTRHPDLKKYFDRAIDQSRSNLVALTHGDWSPKNFLVNPGPQLLSIDYEVIHFGDPSFDVAFLLNHFLLKGWHRARSRAQYAALALTYWQSLQHNFNDLEANTLRHLGCLHLARLDGKSPVKYLSPAVIPQVRRFARDLIQNPPPTISEVFEMQAEAFHE